MASGVSTLNRVTGQSQLDPAVIQRYADLPMPPDTVLAEYVWVDADGNTRSKTRTLPPAKVRPLLKLGWRGR
jgi:glutamine synthetase